MMDGWNFSFRHYATLLINGKITDIEINPEHYGIPMASKDDIIGEGQSLMQTNSRYFIKKNCGAKLYIVLLNAAAALIIDEKVNFKDGIDIAKRLWVVNRKR